MLDILLAGSLKYEHFSAAEGDPDGLCEGTSTFEAKIKDVIEVTIEFHMKRHIVLHMLVQNCAHNNSMNDELEEALYVSLEGFSLKRTKNCKTM